MTAKWLTGQAQPDYIDVCALSAGFAIVIVDGMDVVCFTAASANAIPTELWRVTSTMPISFIRCAARTDTDEVRAIGMGTSAAGATTAEYFTSTTQTAKGTAYGIWPVLLQYSGGDWVGYIARTAKTYTRWPFAGAEPAAVANPFTLTGSNLGMIQVVGSTVTWRELTPNTAANAGKLKTTTVSGVTLAVPMVISGVTVGQSLGPPWNTTQILAAHDTTELSTIFAMQGETPHVAELADGSFVIVARTQAIELPRPVYVGSTGYSRAAYAANLPQWPDYDARASQGPNDIKMSWDNPVTTGGKGGGNKASEVYQKSWQRIADRLAQRINLDSTAVSGGSSGGGGGPVPSPLIQDADVMAGSDIAGFPNGRLPIDTATVEWDMTTPNEFKANVVPSSLSSWIPLVDGSEPPVFITDGAGVLILVAYP